MTSDRLDFCMDCIGIAVLAILFIGYAIHEVAELFRHEKDND